MISPDHLRLCVIQPVNKTLAPKTWNHFHDNLMLGTACAESECGRWLIQREGGPGLGVWQMEPGMTGYQDCWVNYLSFRPDLANKVLKYVGASWPDVPEPRVMIGNLYFAAAMARIKYLRDSAPIPDTLGEQAVYYKRIYNTPEGKGSAAEYIRKWDLFVGRGYW